MKISKNMEALKGLMTNPFKKKGIAALSACILVLCGLFLFAKHYYIPIPFDPDHMWVDVYKAAVVNENGYMQLYDIERFKDLASGDSGDIRNALKLVYQGINNMDVDIVHRSVTREGQTVKVYYYCYRENLWDTLFSDPGLMRGGVYLRVNGNGCDSSDYEPQLREIYYLPVKDIEGLEKLSDGEYDGLREEGRLIWSGIS